MKNSDFNGREPIRLTREVLGDKELDEQIEKSMPERLKRYGIDSSALPELETLHVESDITLEKPNYAPIPVRDYHHLRELLGDGVFNERKKEQYEYIDREMERLLREIDSKPDNIVAKHRRLGELFLFSGQSDLSDRVAKVLYDWRRDITLFPILFKDIIIYPKQTLTVNSNVHILWANKFIIHPGGKVVTNGAVKIDAFRMEIY